MALGKKRLDLGIIIGENRTNFLSFDEYAEHFLLPFSPRFCCIDFAVSSISSSDIKNIVVFVKRDKDIVLDYLSKGWPNLRFYVFDYIDIKEKFALFLNEYIQEQSLDLIMIMKGNYPVWLDLKSFQSELEKGQSIAIKTNQASGSVYSGLVVEKNIFIKKYESLFLDEANLNFDLIQKIIEEFKIDSIDVNGYIMPFQNLKEYYEIHMNMLEDYLVFDRFNAYVPVRGGTSLNISSNLSKGAHMINSIIGENVEIAGRIENSIIFSNVKIDRNAYIKNSLIFPGNHIGSNVHIVNSIIDEYSEDNTIPNIEPYASIGSEHQPIANITFPDFLNFGITLIGKDARIPASTKIGGNCYLDSFLTPSIIREHKVLRDGQSIIREKEE